jgi:hypothetical protein
MVNVCRNQTNFDFFLFRIYGSSFLSLKRLVIFKIIKLNFIMRAIFISALLLISANLFSQSGRQRSFDSTLMQLKAQSKIDKNDSSVFSLLENFYDEVLQSDAGELSEKTRQKLIDLDQNDDTRNKYLLTLFIIYQNHISQTAAQEKSTDMQFQLACINSLEHEMMTLYNKVPVIVYLYKVEALHTAGHFDESKKLADKSLKKFPHSIPLKVYKFLFSRDETVKRDLVDNHSGHWMVQQFGIK